MGTCVVLSVTAEADIRGGTGGQEAKSQRSCIICHREISRPVCSHLALEQIPSTTVMMCSARRMELRGKIISALVLVISV